MKAIGNGKPSLVDCGEELFGGRVRCRYRGCRRWCASWLGLAVHLRKCHGVSVEEVSWSDLRGV
ncbi:MAG: hypothetical protein ABC612_05205 [Candidatus Methanosuratincola petrocarbonis]